MRIAFVISSLGAGGAERVASILANAWVARNIDVTMLTLAEDGDDFYELDPAVHRVTVGRLSRSGNLLQGAVSNLKRGWALRRALHQARPDVLISFGEKTNIVCLFAVFGRTFPVFISERVDVRHHHIGFVWNTLRKLTYRSADVLVLQTKEVAEVFSYLQRVRTAVIPNPVLPATRADGSMSSIQRPFIMGMGRLVKQKGFDLLLSAFALSAPRHPGWLLAIVGDGPDRSHLERQARELGIADRVVFTGTVKNPFRTIGVPDVFVLSSRFEGFPNALLESMAHGAPVISFDCPTGPREIIRNGYDGILVPVGDVSALSESMGKLMSDVALRSTLARHARETVQRFSVQNIADQWIRLCDSVVSSRTEAASAAAR